MKNAGLRYLAFKPFEDYFYFKNIHDYDSLAAYEAFCDESHYE